MQALIAVIINHTTDENKWQKFNKTYQSYNRVEAFIDTPMVAYMHIYNIRLAQNMTLTQRCIKCVSNLTDLSHATFYI